MLLAFGSPPVDIGGERRRCSLAHPTEPSLEFAKKHLILAYVLAVWEQTAPRI
jgi:hypothetical protein